nr:aspartate-semialdehyde dehydrogenase [Akkermansiaceae bacterium]
MRAWAEGREPACREYPHPIAFNVLAQIGGVNDPARPGVTSEELKMEKE